MVDNFVLEVNQKLQWHRSSAARSSHRGAASLLLFFGHLLPRRFFALDERFGKRVEFQCTDVMKRHRFLGGVRVTNPHAHQNVVRVHRELVDEGLGGDILGNDIRQSRRKTRARCVFSIKLFVPVQVGIHSRVCDEGTAVVLHEDVAVRHATHQHR